MDEGGSFARDEELSLPKATVYKLVSEMMPADMTCAKGTKDLIVEFCVEFIHLIATQSTEICEEEGKKTIGGEHVVAALEKLGFVDIVPEVKKELEELKKTQKDRERKPNKLERSGLSEEELIRQQELLFSQAREKYQQQQHHQPVADPATTSDNNTLHPIINAVGDDDDAEGEEEEGGEEE